MRQRNAECPSIPANEVCMNEQNVLASLAPIQLQGSYSTTPMAAHWEGPQPRCRPGPTHTCVSLLGRIFPGPSSLPTVMSDLRHITAVLHEAGTAEASWAQVPSPPWKQRGTGSSDSCIYCHRTQYTLWNLKADCDLSSITKIYRYTDTQCALQNDRKTVLFMLLQYKHDCILLLNSYCSKSKPSSKWICYPNLIIVSKRSRPICMWIFLFLFFAVCMLNTELVGLKSHWTFYVN